MDGGRYLPVVPGSGGNPLASDVGVSPLARGAVGVLRSPPVGCPHSLAATGILPHNSGLAGRWAELLAQPPPPPPLVAAGVVGAVAYTDGCVMDGSDPHLAAGAWGRFWLTRQGRSRAL